MSKQPTPVVTGARTTHTLAVISIVGSVLGLVQFLPLLGSVVGLVTGYMARSEIRENPARYDGDGLAAAGIALGWIGIALPVFGLCVAFAVVVVVFGGLGGLLAFIGAGG